MQTEAKDKKKQGEEEEPKPCMPTREELEHHLERIKWHVWHGNVFRARQIGEDLEEDLEMLEEKNISIQKMLRECGNSLAISLLKRIIL